eukprot:4288412-Amphidinium_carterae.1
MHELRSPTMPPLRAGTAQQEWHYKPPDQPPLEQSQRAAKFPTFPKRTTTTVQPPPGLQPTSTRNNNTDADEKKLSMDNMILQY